MLLIATGIDQTICASTFFLLTWCSWCHNQVWIEIITLLTPTLWWGRCNNLESISLYGTCTPLASFGLKYWLFLSKGGEITVVTVDPKKYSSKTADTARGNVQSDQKKLQVFANRLKEKDKPWEVLSPSFRLVWKRDFEPTPWLSCQAWVWEDPPWKAASARLVDRYSWLSGDRRIKISLSLLPRPWGGPSKRLQKTLWGQDCDQKQWHQQFVTWTHREHHPATDSKLLQHNSNNLVSCSVTGSGRQRWPLACRFRNGRS